ncbi:50S ribosomal protein L25 [Candidatus Kaiserbacteria bacterium]|nr:50S ribosomal protein L25 [Candidatus Kaiserbacteria bacterium]
MPTLQAEKRERAGAKAPALRRAGKVPGVVYGPRQEAVPIAVEARLFDKVLREAGESSIVTLSGLPSGDIATLIHEVDYDPITYRPRHVDFYAVIKGEKVEVAIPLTFVGVSSAVEAGANLVKVAHEISVEADPMNLPREIEVDLSALKEVGDQIRAQDLPLPKGVELTSEPDEVIALAQEVVEEKVEEAPRDLESIEVEKKGKEEETGEAPTEEAK